MDSNAVIILSAIVGGGGLAALLRAAWDAYKESRREPLDHQTIRVSHQVDLVGAADQLVQAQSSVIRELQSEVALLRSSMKALEERFERVLDDLNNEKQLGTELAHELERYRMQVAQRDERIADLESRVKVLEAALRKADIDPDSINGSPV